MASSFKLRRFSNPAILKEIARPLLIRFLDPYQDFLASREFALVDSDEFDHEALAGILMSPAEDTPDQLMDALFFVDEMSLQCFFEDLMTEAHATGIDLGATDDITPADLAVRVWLEDRNILEHLHAERFLVRPKSFQSFLSAGPDLPDVHYPSDAVLQAIENNLNEWFDTRKKGRGTRVFPFVKEDGIWFLIRHGDAYKREGTLKGGESSSIFYRPEKFDVLIYNPEIGELAIHARNKGEKEAYCKYLGRHIFGSDAFFDVDRLGGRFTLEPIRLDGRACVACGDIEGVEEIRLTELQFRHDSEQYHVEVHKADDVFLALDEIGRAIPEAGALVQAGFKVKFDGAIRPRTVVIRPPNIAIFDRESDSDVVNRWLTERHFIQIEGAHSADADTVLEVPGVAG